MKRFSLGLLVIGLSISMLVGLSGCGNSGGSAGRPAQKKTKIVIANSLYVGWQPWDYAQDSGILKKWGDKYGYTFEVKLFTDYADALNAYSSGSVDCVTMTNIDAILTAAPGKKGTTAIVVGDYSNGNDALLTRNNLGVKDLAGKEVSLVESTVSQLLLALAAESEGVPFYALRIKNVKEDALEPSFETDIKQVATVTWNPHVMALEKIPGARKVFDSSKIPGVIVDLLVMDSHTLSENGGAAEALVGAWYETIALITNKGDPKSEKAILRMADIEKVTPVEFNAMLTTTALFTTPKQAIDFSSSALAKDGMAKVMKIISAGQLGREAKQVASGVGVLFPDGTTLGSAKDIALRFDMSFTEKAKNGQLK